MTSTLLMNVDLWPGEGPSIQKAVSILITNGRVAEIGPAAKLVAPQNATIVDCEGVTAIPGLSDVHVHLTTNSDMSRIVDNATYRAMVPGTEKLLHGVRNGLRALAAGFTTLRIMGHRDSGDIELRNCIDRGLLPGPRLSVAPWVISMTGGRGDLFYPAAWARQPLDTADGVDECRLVVRAHRKLGADFIKFTASAGTQSAGDKVHWPNYTLEEMKVIVSEAHDYDMKVAAHAHSTEGIRRVLAAGIDTVEHGSFMDDGCIETMLKQDTILVPTLSISDFVIHNSERSGARPEGITKMKEVREVRRRNLKKAIKAGVKIAMGTDSSGNLCPFGNHARELELYVELGMSPLEALETATVRAAEALGREDVTGLLTKDAIADVVLLNSNPLEDIGVLRREGGIRAVYKDGIDVSNPWPAVF
ncbi:amidohydrolase family protein [Roseovarius pelagicus]|uniref:Amidohydrolase family protein n=1 Tax=Roseovarius pelagicus TaxID=2980108 RepID=A0ABY6D605_9RHOB|nr:amidohydrolase family protein [Roseovarius pelagicus]UXX81533.1 amidohydrolase family protein [Roseovarius pelagicus]